MSISAVFFDLDGTLLEEGLSEIVLRTSRALAAERPELDAEHLARVSRATWDAYWRETAEAFVMGTRSGDEVSREVWRQTLQEMEINEPGFAERAFHVFNREATATFRLFEDALPVLDALGSRMPLAVITNGASDVQRRKLVATGIESRFRAVMVSGEHGTPKPDARIFLSAAEQMGVEPGAVLHVGDSLEADVAGASGAGMTGIWLNRHGIRRDPSHPEPHHEIRTLAELPGLL